MNQVQTAGSEDLPRFLSRAVCAALISEICALGKTRARAQMSLVSQWRGDVRWARNQPHIAGDWRETLLTITRSVPYSASGIDATAVTNQVDSDSLASAVEWADRTIRMSESDGTPWWPQLTPEPEVYPQTHIWSDATYAQTPEARSTIAGQLVAGATRAGMLSAGYLAMGASGTTYYTADGQLLYAPQTFAQCSLTVRDPQGTGSGWAGVSSYAWERIDAAALAAVALEKCLASRNPVRIEPGRYTTILEPQATFDLANIMMNASVPRYVGRVNNEYIRSGLLPFNTRRTMVIPFGWKGKGEPVRVTRIGERVIDERLTITYDPLDPDLGMLPFQPDGEPLGPVTWFERGVLKTLEYDRDYARRRLHQAEGMLNSGAFRMSGGTETIAEMIATTQRGILVTRFWGTTLIDGPSMLCTGYTRDGLWLIEKGKISKPVKNLAWTESPMFAFNNVEQVGVPVPIFNPYTPALVPPMKVRDFSFTAVADAV